MKSIHLFWLFSILCLSKIRYSFTFRSTLIKSSFKQYKPRFSIFQHVDDIDASNALNSIDFSLNTSKPNEYLNNSISQYLTPDIIAIMTIYFVQGAIGLSRLAVTYFMKDSLHISPSELAAIQGITTLPWIIKPFYGFLSDGIPIFGYKRRSYLIISGIIGCLSWISLATFIDTTLGAVIATIMGSASVAVADVVADSLVVEKSRSFHNQLNVNANSGDLQSLCWMCAAIGGTLSAYFSGSLLQYISIKDIFFITSLFPLFISIASFFITETKSEDLLSVSEFKDSVQKQIKQLVSILFQPAIYLPVLFIFMWQATPSAETAMFYFSTNVLKFQPEFQGTIRLVSSIASLLGVLAYRTWFKSVSIKQLILWTTLISVPLSMTQIILTSRYNLELGIPDQLFALTETSVLSVLGQLAFMPTLVLAASLCPPGVEGTLFATLMSIYNAAGSISSETGAWLTSLLGVTDSNFDNLSLLVVLASISSLFPLFFIQYLDQASVQKDSESVE